ncbi:glycosyltransferase [Janthinobacterium fluminis]|uniref:Glycosyltransferase n=1 Tax=Janthinobacterium fluminis TaxID=2987524 RepID=A0ABT5K067_9BURK|nr:glycosyltransferase [Janthinobacterium fluminis]MDC8758364.1 glycosyltransferase [Janthinobacterium fluminis]
MHVVDITMFYAAEGGGVSTYLDAKACWLAGRRQLRHTVVSPNARAGAAAAVVGIPGFALPGLHGYRMPRSVAAAARVLRTLDPDLIEAGDAGPCAWAALRVARQLRVPAVAFCHSDLPQLVRKRFGALAAHAARRHLAQLYRRFDLVLAPSRMMAQQLVAMGVAGALHQPLGIDTGVFCPQRRDAALRAQLGLAADARLLLYAGRFTPEKKLALLAEAVGRLGRPYHLLLVGGGAVPPSGARITVIPFQREPRVLAGLLASCDLLVHPGDSETFGLIVLEAMACGLPVVGTSAGGVAELVDEATGILVAPNSAAALADGIAALYRRDRAALAAAARRKACACYDWNDIMPQLLQRYAGVLAARQRLELEAACGAG